MELKDIPEETVRRLLENYIVEDMLVIDLLSIPDVFAAVVAHYEDTIIELAEDIAEEEMITDSMND